MPVRRVYIEKLPGFDSEAGQLGEELAGFLGRDFPVLRTMRRPRVFHRYDAEALDEEQFARAVREVFSEPQCDAVFCQEEAPGEGSVFGVEYCPGQYDQRSDSAEQCIALICGARPVVRCADVYRFAAADGSPLPPPCLAAIKKHLINPVDSREANLALPAGLDEQAPAPAEVPVLAGFREAAAANALAAWRARWGLAMSVDDLAFCGAYFSAQGRDPTLTELRVLDTYWSDHCRHSTFTTALEICCTGGGGVKAALERYYALRDEVYGPAAASKKITLMDMAVIGAKALKRRGLASDVDESAEINACTIRVQACFQQDDGTVKTAPWLLLFKNETHNHPTEIEPFGGAATCLGGAIRDPLSGRAYVHQALRLSGGADPRPRAERPLRGKLPQVKIAREAAAGYSSYGNQIGLATGQVAECYHEGFRAKRLELGAVIGAAPEAAVRREEPAPGDVVILVGGRTGRDGIGGATGSSKGHTGDSVGNAGPEVQKGNPVEERKLQRLFRDPSVTRLIKRCNDFGAGGVAVAVGELAAGLEITLDAVPRKYAGLDGTELAISESQERMAALTAAADAEAFIAAAAAENLEATVIAKVTDSGRMVMRWRGKTIAALDRSFLDSNGAPRSARAILASRPAGAAPDEDALPERLSCQETLAALEAELASLRSGSRRGLQERFDGSIGAGSVLFPFGGDTQGTPECGLASLLPDLPHSLFPQDDEVPGTSPPPLLPTPHSPLPSQALTASLMTFGYDPEAMERNPYEGAKGSVREALAKFACVGGDPFAARLSLQEYFPHPEDAAGWGLPAEALLGALEAQIETGVPAIGGKDSMSGNFRDPAQGLDLKVPPVLAAFAAGVCPVQDVRSGALSGAIGSVIVMLAQRTEAEWACFRANMGALAELRRAGVLRAAYPVGAGGPLASLCIMAFGSMMGVQADSDAALLRAGERCQGSVLLELDGPAFTGACKGILAKAEAGGGSWRVVAAVTGGAMLGLRRGEDEQAEAPLATLRAAWESVLEEVYPQTGKAAPPGGIRGVDRNGVPAGPGVGGAESKNAGAFFDFGVFSVRLRSEKTPNRHCISATPAAEQRHGNRPPSKKDSPIKSGNDGRFKSHTPPLVLIPVFPGTNCEWDMERAFRRAGARTRVLVFRNRTQDDISESIAALAGAMGEAQILALSGGFSAGDEPDGSGKFIVNVLRSPRVADALGGLLETRDGLVLGICNGFQALIKVGLVPYGTLRTGPDAPTLTCNRVGRHVSRMVRTRVMRCASPWLAAETEGALHVLPVSHGEGRLAASEAEAARLFAAGQVAFCYAAADGGIAQGEPDNPNGSCCAIEGLCSPDGRVLGKMAHSERCGPWTHINIPGPKEQRIFEGGVGYFR
ncbi:MAG: phosphoribosylformylglycinamidine synthase subunit PurQ [Treponema sp.]|nr:phosphoribosylformylglycinamidine synthase subunit PurQ [Treponema sp.]